MTAQPANLSAFIDAARDSLAREIATARRETQRERDGFAAEMRAIRAEWETRLVAVSELERRLSDRLATLKDGEPGRDGRNGVDGRDGKDGVPGQDGRDGRDGVDGRNGTSVSLVDLEPVVAEAVGRAVATIPTPQDGRDGADGKDGRDGLDGASITVEDVTPVIEAVVQRAVAAIPGPIDGRDGADGKDGRDGLDGASVSVEDLMPAVAEAVARAASALPSPKDGRDGVDGKDGRDGLDGKNGEPGRDGAPGKLPVVRGWSDAIHYEGDVVCHAGSTYQAARDTAKEPPHEDWICIARAGADGRDGRSFTIRGTWSEDAAYHALDVVALGGASFAARRDEPGSCPGEGWQLIAAQGKRGAPGERSMVKGDPGKAAPIIRSMTIDDDGLLTITNSDGTTVECDLYPLLSKLTRPDGP